jgi:hypothetical protein
MNALLPAAVISLNLLNGTVLVGSDAHIWPGPPTTAMTSFVWAAKKLKPDIVCMNGDVLDGATISRFPRANWSPRPTLAEELGACQQQLRVIRKAAPRAARIWVKGNHDDRFGSCPLRWCRSSGSEWPAAATATSLAAAGH